MFVPYCTRERFSRAADVTSPAWLSDEIDQAIEAGSRAVDKLVRRGDETRPAFAPWTGTIEYDWPALGNSGPWRFWLGPHSLISTSAVTAGGVDVTASAIGYPAQYGPPYDALDLDQAIGSVYATGDGVGQRSLGITGVWSATLVDERNLSSWVLDGSISSGATTADIVAPVGVGSLVRIGSERMIVTDRDWTATADTATLSASMAAQSLTVASGAAYVRGDTLSVEGERMIVRDIVSNTLTVQRAADGSTLAAHTTAAVFVLRTCTLARAQLGTTAAGHTDGDLVYVHRYPPLVEQLAVAYGLDQRAQENSGYARTVGTGDGTRNASGAGIKALEDRVLEAYGRVLSGAV